MKGGAHAPVADVCLVLEGTYPYVRGGVSSWVHDLIRFQPDLTFHLACLLPHDGRWKRSYDLPDNVVGMTHVFLQSMPAGRRWWPGQARLFRALEEPLVRLQTAGSLDAFRELLAVIEPHRGSVGSRALLRSQAAWDILVGIYERTQRASPFLEFYWTWRALFSALYSVLLAPLPEARVYHSASTGYAGLFMSRAVLGRGRPGLVTEHGIYTNERRIEIAMADWIYQAMPATFAMQPVEPQGLKQMWKETFAGYSRICYEACDHVLTIFEGNQEWQIADGAPPAKMGVIPNGVDIDRFSGVVRRTADPSADRPTVALIGRVVPIKDVKTFIRACALVQRRVSDLRALVVGPTDEDPVYMAECEELVRDHGLNDCIVFTGHRKIEDVLAEIDLCVLTSISEGQPLTILEAGAAGIPFVATDVGACRELIMGRPGEDPPLGPGGMVTALADAGNIADAMEVLLTDRSFAKACGRSLQERVRKYYDKQQLLDAYNTLYRSSVDASTRVAERAA